MSSSANDISARVMSAIAREAGVDPTRINPETELDALGMSSLDRIEFGMVIEDLFGFETFHEDAPLEWKTVQQVVDFVVKATQPPIIKPEIGWPRA